MTQITQLTVPMENSIGGTKVAPQSLGEVVRFAEVMARADIALPIHLRENAGACMAVALQAMEWEMSPFAVASKSYSVNGTIAYESQLITAVVNTRSKLKGRLNYEFDGEGENLTCKVTGEFETGEVREYSSPPIGSITIKNSPLWKTDPEQQLAYYSSRSWARRHCPEVILGAYDRDEAEQFQGPDNAKDVTPESTVERLRAHRQAQEVGDTHEGFDPDHVSSEVDLATGELEIPQNEISGDGRPASDEAEGGADPSNPAPSSIDELVEGEAVASGATSTDSEGGDAGGVDLPLASSLSPELDPRLKDAAAQMLAVPLMDVGEMDKRDKLTELKDFWKGNIREADHDKLATLFSTSQAVMKGDVERRDAIKYYAELMDCEPSELEADNG